MPEFKTRGSAIYYLNDSFSSYKIGIITAPTLGLIRRAEYISTCVYTYVCMCVYTYVYTLVYICAVCAQCLAGSKLSI